MPERITITVAAGGDDANARAFGKALGDILDILEALAREQLGNSQPAIWRIVGLRKASPPSVTLECRQPVKVVSRFFGGWRELQNGPANPFPARAMRATRRLGRRLTARQVDSVVLESPGAGSVAPTETIAENADLALTTKYYFAPSSVDGKLNRSA